MDDYLGHSAEPDQPGAPETETATNYSANYSAAPAA
jgi:hypothetical protein